MRNGIALVAAAALLGWSACGEGSSSDGVSAAPDPRAAAEELVDEYPEMDADVGMDEELNMPLTESEEGGY